MAEDSKDNGKTTRWKVREFSHGLMEEDMKDSMLMIRKKDKEHFSGLTAENTKETGPTENNMESVFTQVPQERQRKENGLKERE